MKSLPISWQEGPVRLHPQEKEWKGWCPASSPRCQATAGRAAWAGHTVAGGRMETACVAAGQAEEGEV